MDTCDYCRYYDLHDGDELWSDDEQDALNEWQRKPDRPKVQVKGQRFML